jgi:hypothetical protein
MKKNLCAFILLAMTLSAIPAYSQAAREATIEPETKAKIVLQTRLSSKLSEVGDTITAVLEEPVYVNSQLVISRGTEFHGRVTEVTPAKRGHKAATLAIAFERIAMPWGDEPVSVVLVAIDDWDKDEKRKADDEGKVSGGHRGKKTADNVYQGGKIGSLGAAAVILSGGGLATGGAAIGGGLLGGLLLTKGGEVQVNPGAVFRIKFVKPATFPVIQQPGSGPRPIQQDGPAEAQNPNKKP